MTPFTMGAGGDLAIRPPIGLTALVFAAATEVEPREGILIGPQKRCPNVVIVGVGVRIALPGVPGIWRKRMRRRPDAKQVHRRKLAILVVSEFDEALRSPTMREEFPVAVGHPGEVIAAVQQGREVNDLSVLMKMLTAGQCRGEQPDAIARGYLDVFPALTGVNVEEVIEPAVGGEHCAVGVAAECAANAIFRLLARDPPALRTDAERRQGKAGHAGASP